MRLSTITLVISLFVQSCNNGKERRELDDIYNPVMTITFKELMDNGYTISGGAGVDVPILQRMLSDTLLYYQFGSTNNDSQPISMFKQFSLAKKDSAAFVYSETMSGYSLVCERQQGMFKTLLVKQENNFYYWYSFTPIDSSKLQVSLRFDYPLF